MSAIATMKALVDNETHLRLATSAQLQPLRASVRHPIQPLPEHPSPLQRTQPQAPEIDAQLFHQGQSISKTSSISTPSPKLTITPTALVQQTDSASSSLTSSPTSSTSSSFAGLNSHDTVSFSFSSPLFYDQKLYIYQSLLKLYQLLGRCIEQHPTVLLILQYSIAAIHGCTVYLLSVILSIAQLIMITATIENLDWIQTYKPLMCEWDSRFPGFVFPALDIESETEEDALDELNRCYSGHKGGRYWASKATLKPCDDLVYRSEESQKRMSIQQCMSSTLIRRIAKCQQWIPSIWAAEDGSIVEETVEEGPDESDEDDDVLSPDHDHYSNRIRRALVRTLSGHLRPQQSKRVTFNEQVLVFGRRRSSQVSQSGMTPMASILHDDGSNAPAPESPHSAKETGASMLSTKDASPPLTSNREPIYAMAREEAEYQRRNASEDTNGSGTSSPVFQPDLRRTPTSPTSSVSSESFSNTSAPFTSLATTTPAISSVIMGSFPDLKRSSSAPHRFSSFLHRHHQNAAQKSAARRSATFSESSTVSRSMSAHSVLPSQPSTGPGTVSLTAVRPDEDSKLEVVSPRTSLSLGTRAKRSFSLVLPKHNLQQADSSDGDNSPSSLDRQGSKNKNFMYRIVHPQRYKREMEQQLSQQGRQRLLAMVEIQRRYILEEDSGGPTGSGHYPSSDTLASRNARNANTVLCGDAYYYATSAEYVEGLGAPNSVISTSIGTSFPEELQPKRNKSRTKQPRPVSYDHAFQSVSINGGAGGCGYGSESDLMRGAEKGTEQQQHKFLFKRDSKKVETGFGSGSGPRQQRTHSPNRLQQLFSHPGHKQTQSTSSLINPPGALSAAVAAATAASAATATLASEEAGNNGGCTAPPIFSSPAAAGAHRLLSRARSSSRNFTSFTALGMPANPPAQQPTMMTPILDGITCPLSAVLSSQDPAMEHTTFAAFGFPSPTQSPVNSTPASPRHSMSSMPWDTLSRMQVTNEFHADVNSRHTFLSGEQAVHLYDQDHENYQQQYHHQQQQYPQQEREQQEMLLEDDGYQQDTSFPQAGTAESTEDEDAGNYLNSNHSSRENSFITSSEAIATKPNRGLSFIRKLSIKRKKQQQQS